MSTQASLRILMRPRYSRDGSRPLLLEESWTLHFALITLRATNLSGLPVTANVFVWIYLSHPQDLYGSR